MSNTCLHRVYEKFKVLCSAGKDQNITRYSRETKLECNRPDRVIGSLRNIHKMCDLYVMSCYVLVPSLCGQGRSRIKVSFGRTMDKILLQLTLRREGEIHNWLNAQQKSFNTYVQKCIPSNHSRYSKCVVLTLVRLQWKASLGPTSP